MVTVYFARLRPEARVPSRRAEDAGYDIYASFAEPYVLIRAGETKLVPTGIASAFDCSWYMQLQERGSMGAKGLAVLSGVIDSGFRGEWMVGMTNHSGGDMYIASEYGRVLLAAQGAKGWVHPVDKAICQAVLLPVPECAIAEISPEELRAMPSDRGAGMLGSSGK